MSRNFELYGEKIEEMRKKQIKAILKRILIKRLDFGNRDHRLSVVDDLFEITGIISRPIVFINAVIDNLPNVFLTVNKISLNEATRRWLLQNVSDQKRLLLESAKMLIEKSENLVENI